MYSCEQNPMLAYESNVKFIEDKIWILQKYDIHLIQVSTDQVYFGNGPHKEENILPCNVYGITKYLSEKICLNINSTILRTNFVGKSLSKKRNSFSDWVVNSVKNGKKITLFNDIFFSPLSIEDLSDLIEIIMKVKINGIFNLGSKGSISKAELGIKLLKCLNLDLKLVTLSNFKQNQNGAKRPNDMSLCCNHFEKTFNLKLPTINDTFTKILKQYQIDY